MNAPRVALPRAPAALLGRFTAHASSSMRPCQHLFRQFSQTQSWSTMQEKVQTIPSYQPYPLNTRPPTQPRDEPIPEKSIASTIPEFHATRPPAEQPQTQVSPKRAPSVTTVGAAAIPEQEAQKKTEPAQPPKRKLRPRKAAIKLTPSAVARLRQLLNQPEPKLIKVGVRNRGCSGLAYHLDYVDRPGPFDEEVEQDGVKVLIDSKALFSIIGSEMDWIENKLSQRFHFNNPNIIIQAYTFLYQYAASWAQSVPKKREGALKCGVISAARINPAALIHPAETHPDVILYAIASRDKATAQAAAKSYKFQKAYGSYDELLADPEVDFVYIATPNGLHFEWAFKSLQAGKHVLLEKPFTSNADEAKRLVQEAERCGKVLMEAFHWQFHPASHLWRSIIEDRAKYGRIIRTEARMTASPGVPHGDIRWDYDLAGGSFMDCTYALSFTRYALRAGTPEKVVSAIARPYEKDGRVDEAMNATLLFREQTGELVHSRVYTDMARKWIGGVIPRVWEFPAIEVETEKAVIYYYNAMMPHLYHYISITDKATGISTTVKQYSGGPVWGDVTTSNGAKGGSTMWSTYRYQLEAFVAKCQGKDPAFFVTNEESITQMEVIDACYEKSGLGKRPTSQFLQ
ncbi:hypothetical protein DL767_000453 [Monosporascus sp. MG133]|nr:hypothetical protein DL767_000453 [Monosporascus sp. MG133]